MRSIWKVAEEQMRHAQLQPALTLANRGAPRLLFSTKHHGFSMSTLIRRAQPASGPVIMVFPYKYPVFGLILGTGIRRDAKGPPFRPVFFGVTGEHSVDACWGKEDGARQVLRKDNSLIIESTLTDQDMTYDPFLELDSGLGEGRASLQHARACASAAVVPQSFQIRHVEVWTTDPTNRNELPELDVYGDDEERFDANKFVLGFRTDALRSDMGRGLTWR